MTESDKTQDLPYKSREITKTEVMDYSPGILDSGESSSDGKIPWIIKILYALPNLCKLSSMLLMSINSVSFFESEGASILLISFFVALARAIEVFLKPVIAHYSDTAIFKQGRRKPFMNFGCVFFAFFLVLMFNPPFDDSNSMGLSIWFGVVYICFYVFDTIVNIPFMALGPEISTNSVEREKMYILVYITQYIGAITAAAAPVLVKNQLAECDCSACDEKIEKNACILACQAKCNTSGSEIANNLTSIALGAYFICTIFLLSTTYKEKKFYRKRTYKPHIVASLQRLLANKPFMIILLAWILDSTVVQIFTSVMPFYVDIVLNPQKVCILQGKNLTDTFCTRETWVALILLCFMIGSIISTIMWHSFVPKLGRKQVWQWCNLVAVITIPLLFLNREGSFWTSIIVSFINSFSAGGFYLSEVLTSDVIDYDELLTGERNEGIFLFLGVFIPKIVSIAAQSLPLSIMSFLGYKESKDGISFAQPQSVSDFLVFYVTSVPLILGLLSLMVKSLFPINKASKMEYLTRHIVFQRNNRQELQKHFDYSTLEDPIYEKEIMQIYYKTEEELKTKAILDNFGDINSLKHLKKKEFSVLEAKFYWLLLAYFVLVVLFVIGLFFTFKYLEDKSLSLLPLILLIATVIVLIFAIVDWKKANAVKECVDGFEINEKILDLTIKQHIMSSKKNMTGVKYELHSLIAE